MSKNSPPKHLHNRCQPPHKHPLRKCDESGLGRDETAAPGRNRIAGTKRRPRWDETGRHRPCRWSPVACQTFPPWNNPFHETLRRSDDGNAVWSAGDRMSGDIFASRSFESHSGAGFGVSSLYARRTPGRDRDHRDADRVAVAGCANGPRGSATLFLHEQPPPDRLGDAYVP